MWNLNNPQGQKIHVELMPERSPNSQELMEEENLI